MRMEKENKPCQNHFAFTIILTNPWIETKLGSRESNMFVQEIVISWYVILHLKRAFHKVVNGLRF